MNNLNTYVGLVYTPPRGCWDLVRRILADRGIAMPDFSELKTPDEFAQQIALESQAWTEVSDPRAGDLVLMIVAGSPHIGVMVDRAHCLHAPNERRTSCIDWLGATRWRRRITGYYRYDI